MHVPQRTQKGSLCRSTVAFRLPCGNSPPLGCRSVAQAKAAQVSFGVPVVITIVPEVGKESLRNRLRNSSGVSPTRPAYLASANALRLVSFKLSAGFVFGNALRPRIVTEVRHANKLRGFVRTCAVREASKTGKPDNKRITAFFRFLFSERLIAYKATLILNLHPAGLEPVIL